MAGQTIVKKQWGYVVGGVGTDATPVTTGDINVKRVLLSAAASAGTTVIADAAGNTIINWAAPVSLFESVEIGARIKGLTVTMSSSAAGARTSIIVE